MYRHKALLGLFNKINLTPKELFLKVIDFRNLLEKDDRLHFYLFEVDVVNGQKDYNIEKEKNQMYYHVSINMDIYNTLNVENIENQYFEFLKSLDKDYKIDKVFTHLFYSNKNQISHRDSKRYITFSLKNDYRKDLMDLNYYFKLNIGTEELNKDNIYELLKLYLQFCKLNDMSDLKQFKTLFFGNITAKKFDPFLDELANEGKITIEKSKTNAVKLVKLNIIELSPIETHLNKLRQDGIIKTIDSNCYLEFEINDYQPFNKLKLNFRFLKSDKSLEMLITHNNFDYFKGMFNELEELEIINNNDTINKLRIYIITKVLEDIEKLLCFEILNKTFVTNINCGFHLNIAHNKM